MEEILSVTVMNHSHNQSFHSQDKPFCMTITLSGIQLRGNVLSNGSRWVLMPISAIFRLISKNLSTVVVIFLNFSLSAL